jgi:hypothetical protein
MKKIAIIGSIVLILICSFIHINSAGETIFAGRNSLWSGKLVFQKNQEQVNEKFTLYYNGKSPERIGMMKITYADSSGSYTAIKKLNPSTKQITLSSGGQYAFPNIDSVIHVTVEWNGQSQRFDLQYKKYYVPFR